MAQPVPRSSGPSCPWAPDHRCPPISLDRWARRRGLRRGHLACPAQQVGGAGERARLAALLAPGPCRVVPGDSRATTGHSRSRRAGAKAVEVSSRIRANRRHSSGDTGLIGASPVPRRSPGLGGGGGLLRRRLPELAELGERQVRAEPASAESHRLALLPRPTEYPTTALVPSGHARPTGAGRRRRTTGGGGRTRPRWPRRCGLLGRGAPGSCARPGSPVTPCSLDFCMGEPGNARVARPPTTTSPYWRSDLGGVGRHLR